MNKISKEQVVGALMRTNFLAFLMKVFEALHPGNPPLTDAWYLKAICHELMCVAMGEIQRSVILVPPRHLKSITASVAFSAWMLGHDPSCKIMVATYGEELSRQHALQVRAIMESRWYKRLFPNTRLVKHCRTLDLRTTKGGFRRAVSVEGAITGLGADIIIVDDCMKAEDARSANKLQAILHWYSSTLLTRSNDKASVKIISIQQRLHEDDLPGHMIEKGYHVLSLPAIAQKDETIAIGPSEVHHRHVGDLLNPERESQAVLDDLRRQLGHVTFNAQYQQDPVVPEGNLIRMEWFGSYETPPKRDRFLKVVQSWDTGLTASPTSDYTVGTTWGFDRDHYKWYLLDVFRERLDFPDMKRAIVRLAHQYEADDVLIEDASSGKALFDEYRKSKELRPIMVRPVAGKEDRFNGCLAEVEGGHFLLPREAPWVDAFRHEMKAFPRGKYDDQADSFSQFVNWQRSKWKHILTERTASGRKKRIIRHKVRPW